MPWFWPRTASNTKWWCRWSDGLVEGQDSRKKTGFLRFLFVPYINPMWYDNTQKTVDTEKLKWESEKLCVWVSSLADLTKYCIYLYIMFTSDLKWLLSICISEKCTPIIQKSAKCLIYESTWWSRTVACPWGDKTLRLRDVGLFEYSVHQCSMDQFFPFEWS